MDSLASKDSLESESCVEIGVTFSGLGERDDQISKGA